MPGPGPILSNFGYSCTRSLNKVNLYGVYGVASLARYIATTIDILFKNFEH